MHDSQSEIGRQRREFKEFLDRTAVYDAPARPGVTFPSFLPFFSGFRDKTVGDHGTNGAHMHGKRTTMT